MPNKKEYQDINQLHRALEERGMTVDDREILKKVNYSHLIYVFGKHYTETESPTRYREGTKISHIYNLFLMNQKVSEVLFSFFMNFEHHLKQVTAHILAKKDPLWYAKIQNYIDYKECETPEEVSKTQKEKSDLFENLKRLSEENLDKHNPSHLIEGKLPIWLLIDHMAFGQITMAIKFSGFQSKILRWMSLPDNGHYLLLDLKTYRNQIFHGNPITSKIGKAKLSNILKYIKNSYVETFNKLTKIVNETDWKEFCNLEKNYILDYLKITSIFE